MGTSTQPNIFGKFLIGYALNNPTILDQIGNEFRRVFLVIRIINASSGNATTVRPLSDIDRKWFGTHAANSFSNLVILEIRVMARLKSEWKESIARSIAYIAF